jgi:hypothetical protein
MKCTRQHATGTGDRLPSQYCRAAGTVIGRGHFFVPFLSYKSEWNRGFNLHFRRLRHLDRVAKAAFSFF